MYRSESVLWFAIVLLLVAVYLFCYYYFSLDNATWAYLTLAPVVASGVVMLLKNQLLHKCMFVLLIFNLWPTFLMAYHILEWWVVGLIQFGSSILGIVLINLLFHKK